MEAYFDESYGPDSPYLCVAGYLFESERAKALEVEWRKLLLKYSLPFFHMCDCAHGNKPFHALSDKQRVSAQTEAMELVKAHAALGIAVSIDEEHYRAPYDSPLVENPYSFGCLQAMISVQNWAEETNYGGEIAYFFEAGHKHQIEANRFMDRVFREPLLRDRFRYAGHAFVPKVSSGAIQCADIIAWQWYTQTRHMAEGKPMRKDLVSLFEATIEHQHYTKEKIEGLKKLEQHRLALENLKASIIPNYKPFESYVKLNIRHTRT